MAVRPPAGWHLSSFYRGGGVKGGGQGFRISMMLDILQDIYVWASYHVVVKVY